MWQICEVIRVNLNHISTCTYREKSKYVTNTKYLLLKPALNERLNSTAVNDVSAWQGIFVIGAVIYFSRHFACQNVDGRDDSSFVRD